ncbi:MAG: rod shape-determining protein MreD [Desulfobacteraceae bacterium]|nr:rod shape-determining protein MreD [Desulfobacteraceae bacterium]
MVIITFLLLGTILIVLQTSLLPLLPHWLGTPDPLFVLIVFAAIRMETYQGAVLALIFGLLFDIFSGPYLGLYPVVFVILFVVLRLLAVNLLLTEAVHQVPLTLLSYLATTAGLYLFASLLAPDAPLPWSWRDVLLQLFMLAVFTIPLFAFYESLLVRLVQRKKRRSSLQVQAGNRFR